MTGYPIVDAGMRQFWRQPIQNRSSITRTPAGRSPLTAPQKGARYVRRPGPPPEVSIRQPARLRTRRNDISLQCNGRGPVERIVTNVSPSLTGKKMLEEER
ncbi:hypothetical protein E0H51_28230 [Rhizobium leguminosarum bv. viciae]|nr:hypothetical protein [Rhizobium leguminosarum]MBY5754631.1 hypothetical protein [Rhizobium leguminosarum]MBY5798364.1 hypothetical protein [Rhizobium leguminosarum]TBY71107.1 hypothetical protein E0H51_28230 [Rhizobium leguminosarum bv. viciae]TBY81764.1 hypothetical protein E0H32_15925 [Rhizobium leguminosarum bv. viciae]UFW80701.1 FAD-binding domain-containing protein [Rhizobium leguminosarum bv. viciae]